MIKTIQLFILSALIIFYSCSTSRVAVQQVTPKNKVAADYIEKYSAIAISEMKRTGIPASIKLAQGMIESDYGRSRLATQANNHFGVKCHTSWKGPVIYHDDDKRGECFRKYSNPEQSFRDHSDFLVSGSRYKSLFSLSQTDYKGWARGLKSAGYATNPRYADMLIESIEQNGLSAFDNGATKATIKPAEEKVSETYVPQVAAAATGSQTAKNSGYSAAVIGRVLVRNRVEYIILTENDSYSSIVSDFNLLSRELEKYNEKFVASDLEPGQIVYLQPKRKSAEAGIRYHVVKEGETMYVVSQLYAIKLKNLYELNFMDEGTEPEVGRRLNLR